MDSGAIWKRRIFDEEAKAQAAQDWAECQIVIFAGLLLTSLATHFFFTGILGVAALVSVAMVAPAALFLMFVIAPAIYWRAVERRLRTAHIQLGPKHHRRRFWRWATFSTVTGITGAVFVVTSSYLGFTGVLYPGAVLSFLSPVLAAISYLSYHEARNAHRAARSALEKVKRDAGPL